MTPSTAELGSVDKFHGVHVVLDDGAGAVRACRVLLACCNGEAARFEQAREQVVVVHHGLRPSLYGALVLLAAVVVAMVAAAVMVMCDSNKARVYTADTVGAGTTAKQFACM